MHRTYLEAVITAQQSVVLRPFPLQTSFTFRPSFVRQFFFSLLFSSSPPSPLIAQSCHNRILHSPPLPSSMSVPSQTPQGHSCIFFSSFPFFSSTSHSPVHIAIHLNSLSSSSLFHLLIFSNEGMSSVNSTDSSTFSSRPCSATHFGPVVHSAPSSGLVNVAVRQCSNSSSAFDDFLGSESSTSAHHHGGGSHHRSSWANLLSNIIDHRPFLNSASKGSRGTKCPNGLENNLNGIYSSSFGHGLPPPPPYDDGHASTQQHNQNGSTARQNNNGATPSSSPFSSFPISKCPSSRLHFISGPTSSAPFPLFASPPPPIGHKSSFGGQRGAGAFSSSSATGSTRVDLKSPSTRGGGGKKRNRMQELRNLWHSNGCRLCCLLIILTLAILLIGSAILINHLSLPQHIEFTWFAPEQFRSVPISTSGGGGGQQSATSPPPPNNGRLDVGKFGHQIRLELNGAVAMPFRSNFISVIDFKTNQIAILDLSLRSAAAQHNLICFVMDLDRQNIPNLETLLRAAKNGAERRTQLHGWEENWLWAPQPISQLPVFSPEVTECRGARWLKLTNTGTDQKGQKCTECYDFCLPQWGIDHDPIRDEKYLNILWRLCFSLFVPEWRPFAQSLGWQQNQHDFEQFYRRQQHKGLSSALEGGEPNVGGVGRGIGTNPTGTGEQLGPSAQAKWISLQTPQQFGTHQAIHQNPSMVVDPLANSADGQLLSSAQSFGPHFMQNKMAKQQPTLAEYHMISSPFSSSWPRGQQQQPSASPTESRDGQQKWAQKTEATAMGGIVPQQKQQQQKWIAK